MTVGLNQKNSHTQFCSSSYVFRFFAIFLSLCLLCYFVILSVCAIYFTSFVCLFLCLSVTCLSASFTAYLLLCFQFYLSIFNQFLSLNVFFRLLKILISLFRIHPFVFLFQIYPHSCLIATQFISVSLNFCNFSKHFHEQNFNFWKNVNMYSSTLF